MNFVGDYFACGLVIVLCMFFFDGKHRLNRTSRYFVACLALTGATALIDILTGSLMHIPDTPLWLNKGINTLYFIVNILSTSSIALYLFNRILEHSFSKKCMRYAVTGLAGTFTIYLPVVIANWWTGWLFFFDAQGVYCRGPMNSFGYVITIAQMALVVVCYFRNQKNVSSTMRRALVQTFPVVVLSIIMQRIYPQIMLNSFIMSMVVCVIFLNFTSQRPGVHSLTRLNDRHRFFEHLELHRDARSPFQVFIINIKNFGTVNQKYGHLYGDELLYQFAFSLERLIKGSEAFHMNGTVFAIVLPYYNQHTAEQYRTQLLNFLETPIAGENGPIKPDYVTVEYISDNQHENAEQLYEMLEFASTKAYRSKQRYVTCTPTMARELQRRRHLIEKLEHIDREHGFQVWYQPIKYLKDNRCGAAEALIRIVEPNGSIVNPAEFIPLAEETGMVASFTWFVLEEVCRMIHDHPELNNFSVSINMPMSQMLDQGFIVRVNSIVDKYEIDHKRIGLEFTERAIHENFDAVKTAMQQFTRDEYSFYLDDFGAGFSNFNCLLQLPFANIKLDMHLIKTDIDTNGKEKLGLIRTLTGFLHQMGLTVIAEGVETENVAEALRSMEMDRIQGYVYAKPMPEAEFLDFYKKQQKS